MTLTSLPKSPTREIAARAFRSTCSRILWLQCIHGSAPPRSQNGQLDHVLRLHSEEDDKEAADDSSQSAYGLNEEMVPLTDILNMGTFVSRRPFFLIRTSTWILEHIFGSTLFVGLGLQFLLRLQKGGTGYSF